MITGFESFAAYKNFVFAKFFWDNEQHAPFFYEKNRLEKLGDYLTPALRGLDFAGKNIRNPLFITALVVMAIAATTIAFYPVQFFALVDKVSFVRVSPQLAKFALYFAVQTTIMGLALRTLGRLCPNGPLMQAWRAQKLTPISIGTVIQR